MGQPGTGQTPSGPKIFFFFFFLVFVLLTGVSGAESGVDVQFKVTQSKEIWLPALGLTSRFGYQFNRNGDSESKESVNYRVFLVILPLQLSILPATV